MKDPLNGTSWSGPLRNFADVPGQVGMISASTNESPSQNILIVVEPDTVWIQALPTVTQPLLAKFPQTEASSTPNLAATTTNTISAKNEGIRKF